MSGSSFGQFDCNECHTSDRRSKHQVYIRFDQERDISKIHKTSVKGKGTDRHHSAKSAEKTRHSYMQSTVTTRSVVEISVLKILPRYEREHTREEMFTYF